MQEMTFHEEADVELQEAALYYEERAFDLGLTFLEEIYEATQRVLANPKAYKLVGDEVRQAPIRRFPYSILYVDEPDRIRVIAVAHQKRRPGYWHGRL